MADRRHVRSDPLFEQALLEQFGFTYQLLDANPDLKALFHELATSGVYDPLRGEWVVEPMSAQEFTERVKATDAYKARFPSMSALPVAAEPWRRWASLRTALAYRIAPWLGEE